MSELGEFAMWLAIGGGTVTAGVLLYPLVLAIAERIRIRSGATPPGEVEARLTDLQARLEMLEARSPITGEVEAQYQRVAELEERLDFAERLLTQVDAGTRHLPQPRGGPLDS